MIPPLSARSDYESFPGDTRLFDGQRSAATAAQSSSSSSSSSSSFADQAVAVGGVDPVHVIPADFGSEYVSLTYFPQSDTELLVADAANSSATSVSSDGSGSNSARTNNAIAGARGSSNASGQKRKLTSKQVANKALRRPEQVNDVSQGPTPSQLKRELLERQLGILIQQLEDDKRRKQAESVPAESSSTAVSSDDRDIVAESEAVSYFTNLTLAYNRGSMTDIGAVIDRACADNCVLRSNIVKFNDSQPFTDREVQRQDIFAFFKAVTDAFPDSYWRCDRAEIRKWPLFNVVVGHFKYRCEYCNIICL
jgi:hypothetical protein